MSTFSVPVKRIVSPVENHPNADRLSLVHIDGFVCISAKLADGSHRYREGDHVVYIPEASILPDNLLKAMGFWNEADQKGTLEGKTKGNRVKALKIRKVFSQGLLYPVTKNETGELVLTTPTETYVVKENENVADLLGIVKYEPRVPENLSGEVCYASGATLKYDFDSIQAHPDLFAAGDLVVATEKLHGTFSCIGFIPGLKHPYLAMEGDLFICSKGLGNDGFVMKDAIVWKNVVNALIAKAKSQLKKVSRGTKGHPEKARQDPQKAKKSAYDFILEDLVNFRVTSLRRRLKKMCMSKVWAFIGLFRKGKTNVYLDCLHKLLDEGLGVRIKALSEKHRGAPIHIFGEIFGRGIQDLHYGAQQPDYRCFEIAIGRKFLSYDEFLAAADVLGLQVAPLLYRGAYDMAALTKVRDGKTLIGKGDHIREGVVIRSEAGGHNRKIAKFVSPDYLLRNGEVTEFQ